MIIRIHVRPYEDVMFITNTREEYLELRSNYTKDPIDLTYCDGIASDYDHVHVVGIFPPYRMGTVMHELSHVCIKTLGRAGVPINRETSEAFCYLLTDLYNESAELFEKPPVEAPTAVVDENTLPLLKEAQSNTPSVLPVSDALLPSDKQANDTPGEAHV